METEVLETEDLVVKKDKSLAIIIIIGLLFIAATSFLSYKAGVSKKEAPTTEEPVVEKSTNTKVEDPGTISKINDKLKIFRMNEFFLFEETYRGRALELDKYQFKERVIFNYLFGEDYTAKTADPNNYPTFSQEIARSPYGESFNINPFIYVTEEEFVNNYKDLYGTLPENKDYEEMIYFANEHIYVDTLQRENGRSNDTFVKEQKYVYLVEEDSDNYYVYFSYLQSDIFRLYKNVYDAVNNKPFIDCKDKEYCSELTNFKLTESNYKEFQKYKVTFKKDNGDFYIKSLERIIE